MAVPLLLQAPLHLVLWGFSFTKQLQSMSQAGPISMYSQINVRKRENLESRGIFPCQAQAVKAAAFNTHWSPSFQGSRSLQALPVFITCLGASVLE